MKYLKVNDENLSRLVFGGAAISGEGKGYGFGDISENDSIDLVRFAYSRGVNFFDTAPIYGFGTSEIRLGLALKNIREKVFICSKSGIDWHDTKRVNMTNDPKVAIKMFDESRKRLQSDYIDLYMVHWPDENVDIRQTLDPLYKFKEEGKIKYLGLCNTNQEDLDKSFNIDFIQSEFNFFHNGFENLKSDALKMGWGTLDKGILSGVVDKDREFDKSDCRSSAPWWKKSDWKGRVQTASEINLKDKSPLEFHIQNSLDYCDFSIIGMRKKEYVESAIDILK